MGGPRPAIINSIQGKNVIIRYIAKSRGLALLKQAELTPNKDFDWCGGIALDSLQEGSAVEGRYLHGEGGKKWFRGKIAAINSNGTFAISYNDGDYEASVLRENIRTKADRDRPNPQLAQLKGKSMNQSFASSLSPAHRDSESPKQTTKPAQAEPAEATGEAEATRKQAKQSKAAETRVAVKEEPVEEYDGSYACLICGESVRGMEALKCSHWQCESNPLHRACITNPKWLDECPSCKRQTMKPWSGAGGRHAAAVATIDLTTGGGKGRSDAQDPGGGALQPIGEGGEGGGTGAGGKRKREVVAEGGSVNAEAPKGKRVQTDWMADEGRARKRALDAQACVLVLIRSVVVPTAADFGEAPQQQVALSGVYATQAAAEEACAKHQRALAAFCKKQSDELQEHQAKAAAKIEEDEESHEEDDMIEETSDKFKEFFNHEMLIEEPDEPRYFSSAIKVVKMPVLQECPTTEPEYQFRGPPSGPKLGDPLDIVLSDAPNEYVSSGPHFYPHFYSDSYLMDVKPDTFCCVLEDANDEGGGE